jgi:hypothetical protein
MNFEVVAPSPPRPMYDEWQMMNAAEICGHRDFISISQFVTCKAEKFFDRFFCFFLRQVVSFAAPSPIFFYN